jgi:hypothetical protein
MSDERTDQQTLDDHIAARNEVISEYGQLWRQAIERSGVTDEKAVAELLQVCAACYLDGVDKGSTLGIAMFVEKQRIRDRAAFTLAQDPALSIEEAYEQARESIQIENEYRRKAE